MFMIFIAEMGLNSLRLIFICEAVFPENKGGVERWFQVLTRYIADQGDEVVYLNAKGINKVCDGVRYVSVTSNSWQYLPDGNRSIRHSFKFAINVFKFLRKSEYDGIYCAQAPILTIFAVALMKFFKNKITIVEWFEIWPLKYWIRYSGFLVGSIGWLLQVFASQFGDHLSVFTPRAKKALKKIRFGRSKNIVILNGLITEISHLPREGSTRSDIIFLGRLVEEKQPKLAIEVIRLFLSTGWNGHFWLIGQGPLGNELKEVVNMSGLNKNISVIQDADDEFVRSKMFSSFLLLHPSRREGYGLSIVEAAAQGIPTLLIDYSDNAAVDLNINPGLVSRSDVPLELANLVNFAFRNQRELCDESEKWLAEASKNQTMVKSAQRVSNYFRKAQI
jgi:glycosyltransferase involved in cell wall biosynthesis